MTINLVNTYAFSASRKTSKGSRAIQKTPASHHTTQEATRRHHGEYLSPHLPHAPLLPRPMLPRLSPPTIPPTGTPSSMNADKHSAAGGDDLVTGDGDRVDSADSHGDAANKEENTSTTTAKVLNEARGDHVGDPPGNVGGIPRRGDGWDRDLPARGAELHVHVPLLG